MSDIVNIEAYRAAEERYVPVEVYVDMEAHGVNSWKVKSVNGWSALGEYGTGTEPDLFHVYLNIDPITYDQVDAAARLQLRGER